jgi:glycosyltransferase involved in cell wall biosynthesis
MKILINIPGKGKTGGVLGHYESLRKYFSQNEYWFNSNGNYAVKLFNVLIFPVELIKFYYKLITICPDIVVLNPSLYPGVFQRDSIYLKISKALGFKVVVFFHGWYDFYQNNLTRNFFDSHYGKANAIIVLSSNYKKHILSWGFKNKIFISTTKVDDELLDRFKLEDKKFRIENILFLARLEEYKGIYIAIEAYRILKLKYSNIKFTIVGDGSANKKVQKLISNNNLVDISLKGHLSGNLLIKEYMNADLYIFPSFNEGLPATVIEAMAFGLPIISRNVGGLKDFFIQNEMGVLIDSFDPIDFALAIENYIENKQLVRKVSEFNYNYAINNFLSSKVAASFEKILIES